MSREPIPSWFFVLVAVKRDDRYLLVHECKHGQPWYVPAGRVEPGEDFITAAKRETLEEAGIPINVTGIVRFDYSPRPDHSRIRLIVSAVPKDDTPPKSKPDEESLEASWFTLEEIRGLPLRDPEVIDLLAYLENGGSIASLKHLAREGEPFS